MTGGQFFQPFHSHLGTPPILVFKPCLGQQFTQVQVTCPVFYQQQKPGRLFPVNIVGDPDIASGNRFDPFLACGLVEFDQAEQIGQIRQRHSGLFIPGCRGDSIIDTNQSIHDGVFGMKAQMNELRIFHTAIYPDYILQS